MLWSRRHWRWWRNEDLHRQVGALEVLIALGLLTGRVLRGTLVLFFMQMLLTTTGDFVFKNVVLMSAGIVVAGTLPVRRSPA